MEAVADLKIDLKKIKARREALGLSMEQAAKAAGLSGRQTWYHIESGQRPDVAVSTLGKIAKALQCEPVDILK